MAIAGPFRSIRNAVFLVGWCAALSGLAACSDSTGPGEPPFELELEIDGVLERGASVTLLISAGPNGMPPGPIEVTVLPAGSAVVGSDGTLRFSMHGPLTITARHEGPEGRWLGVRTVEVALPPFIAFAMEVQGIRNIYRMRLDGADLLQLTSHPAPDRHPTAAGNWVVFESTRDGNPDLYRVPFGGGTVERLTSTASVDASPMLSLDGTRLAWVSDVAGTPRVWAAHANGSGAGAATQGFGRPGAIEAGPSWNGAGSRLAFVSTDRGVPDLYVIEVATGAVGPLLPPSQVPEIQPRWNPWRDEVAFVSERDGEPGIFLLDVGSGAVRRLTGGPEATGDPAWIAEDRLVYTEWVPGGTELRWLRTQDPGRVHAIPVPGTAPRSATAFW